MIQALTLLKTAFLLLTLVATTPSVPQSVKDQAILIANQAIVVANSEIAKSGLMTTQPVQNPPIVNTWVTPQYITPAPTGSIPNDTKLVTQPKTKMTTLEIINPADGKGLGRNYVAYDWNEFNKPGIADNERPVGFKFPTEENYIYIGVVVKDETGTPVKNAVVEVVATDATQNKTINGSGSTTKVIDGEGQVSTVVFYPFNYQFKTSGEHTITFTSGGVSEEVKINVEASEN